MPNSRLKKIFSEHLICRLEGDNFAVIATNTTEEKAQYLCEKFYSFIKKDSFDLKDISLAFGYATTEKENEGAKTLEEAEKRLYRNKLLNHQSSYRVLLSALQQTLHEATVETEQHSRRLQILARKVAARLNLKPYEIDELLLLCSLHDIGKIAVPYHILTKPDRLNEYEWEVMKQHCEIGYRIANIHPALENLALQILHHHERWDGLGYPKGLKGEEIPLNSRILAILDAYDVMTNKRPYKNGISKEETIKEIYNCKGTQFDPNLVQEFLKIINIPLEKLDKETLSFKYSNKSFKKMMTTT